MTFCDKPAGIEVSLWTDGGGQTEGQTDVEIEIVIQIPFMRPKLWIKKVLFFETKLQFSERNIASKCQHAIKLQSLSCHTTALSKEVYNIFF